MSGADSVKVVLLGEAGVGKTSIIHQFTYHQFDPDCISSISAQFISKTIEYKGYGAIKYDIWDIERLAQIVYRKRENQKLRIRFKNKYKYPLKLIKVPQESDIYDCYVGYISGNCLAAIYKDEGQKLIEKNIKKLY